MHIFDITDKFGRIIYLSKERWQHVAREHNVAVEEIKHALMMPLVVRQSKYDSKVKWYYRFNKQKKNYLFVSVKYLNGKGFVITAYFVRRIK